jgi:hypothetical protein
MPKSGVWPRQKYFAALASIGPDAETRSSASAVMLATGRVLEQQALYEAAERPIVSVLIRAAVALIDGDASVMSPLDAAGMAIKQQAVDLHHSVNPLVIGRL